MRGGTVVALDPEAVAEWSQRVEEMLRAHPVWEAVMPSPYSPPLSHTNDWLSEACTAAYVALAGAAVTYVDATADEDTNAVNASALLFTDDRLAIVTVENGVNANDQRADLPPHRVEVRALSLARLTQLAVGKAMSAWAAGQTLAGRRWPALENVSFTLPTGETFTIPQSRRQRTDPEALADLAFSLAQRVSPG